MLSAKEQLKKNIIYSETYKNYDIYFSKVYECNSYIYHVMLGNNFIFTNLSSKHQAKILITKKINNINKIIKSIKNK